MSTFAGLVFFGAVLWYVVLIFRMETSLKRFFWPAIAAKVAAGIGLGAIYTFHYRVGDTLLFFADGLRLSEFAETDSSSYLYFLFTSDFLKDLRVELTFSGDERALLMVKIVSLLNLVSFNNYWLVTTYVTLLSFLGSWYLVRQIHAAFPNATASAIVAFLFFPSIVFWTSGLIKETLAMGSLYFICGIFLRIWLSKKVSIASWITTLLAIYLLWSLKYYFAGIFLSVIIASLTYRLLSARIPALTIGWQRYVSWLTFFLLLILVVTFLHPNFNAHKLLQVMVNNYEVFHQVSRPEAVIVFENLQPTLASIISHSPEALFAGLFRPLFFDATNALAVLLSAENFVLLFLTLVAVRYAAAIHRSGVAILFVAIIVYVILLAVFITLSTPNFGTLARYRVGYLPFFVFLILLAPPVASRLQNAFRKLAQT
ncbi:MAG TPA: hypothetical protein VGD65_26945 [Chryseosolibacter sp.]